MLDTNTVIYIRDGRIPRSRLERLPAGSVVMSIVSYGELYFGAKKRRIQALDTLQQITSLVPPVVMDLEVAKTYGEIRADLVARGQPIGANDTWIAAHAITLRTTLVTNNEREFRRVKGLKVENWLP
jgi:tRNA(fMet)-specific endonuclease VapC